MAKKNTNTQGMTCEQMKNKLKEVVDAHNESNDLAERQKLGTQALKLKDDYNKVSLLDVYADAMEAENPMLAFIKAYTYPTLSVGSKKDTGNLSIKDDGKAVMNLWDFVEWAAGRNKQVTHALDWKSKAEEAKNVLVSVVEKYINDATVMNVGEFKTALQAAFNSVVMIPGESGNNSIIAKSKACRIIITTCSNTDYKSFKANYGQSKIWQKQFLMFLNRAAEGKEVGITFGDPEEQSTDNAVEQTENEAAQTAEAPAASETEEVKAE